MDQSQVVWLSPPNYLHKHPGFGNCTHSILATRDVGVLQTCTLDAACSFAVEYFQMSEHLSSSSFWFLSSSCSILLFAFEYGVCEVGLQSEHKHQSRHDVCLVQSDQSVRTA